MTTKERIFHSVLFEMIALVILIPLGSAVTGQGVAAMATTVVSLAVIAMVWNYLFNLAFDKVFGQERIHRGLGLRIFHGFSFEMGLVVFTVPFLMWHLQAGFLEVLLLDLGFIIFFLIYAIIFNWSYDQIRAFCQRRMKTGLSIQSPTHG